MEKVKHLLESPQLRPYDSKTTFDTGHTDAVNDAKLDYYSSKLATASSDKTVRIYGLDHISGVYHKLAELKGYESQVWQVSWSHPKIGSLLASASYDGRVIIWKELKDEESPMKSKWYSIFDEEINKVSVNSVAWANPKFGALLAAGSSDGSISVLSNAVGDDEENWKINRILRAHELGCLAVSWSYNSKRFASGGNDYDVKIWSLSQNGKQWILDTTLQGHSDWVFSVEWSPAEDVISSAGRDGRVLVWSKVEEPEKPKWNYSSSFSNSSLSLNRSSSLVSLPEEWISRVIQVFDKGTSFYVSWEPMGTFLCVAANDEEVFIWKKSGGGRWVCVSKPTTAENQKEKEVKVVTFKDVKKV